MTGMQQRAINLISKPPSQRSSQEIDLLLPWMKKKSQLFESVEKDVIMDIIRNCQYECVERDHVIIRQAEKGDCFYIILNGTVSVFIDTRKSGEEETTETDPPGGEKHNDGQKDKGNAEGKQTSSDDKDGPVAAPDNNKVSESKKKPLDRTKFGKFVIKFESGRSFGEIALISDDSVRNASIIADETTDLLVIHRDLYNTTLKAFQEQEYKERRDFAQSHPLFRQWSHRFRHLLEMSLIKEVLTYDTPIVRQGEQLNGLIFITKGRARVQVAPSRHGSQYPEMKPFKSSNDVYELELKRTTNKSIEKKKQRSQQSLKQELVAVRRNEGYAAAEKKMFFKNISLCSVEAGEVIGDIETIMGMETHLQTITCTAYTEIYHLTAKNYDRLITKRNPATVDVLRELVVRKLKSRANTKQGSQIPLLKHMLFKLTEELKPTGKKMPPLKMSKELPERGTLFSHLLSVFVQNKAQLIEPYVPGSIYYREMMREKARIRDNVRNHTKQRESGAMLKSNLKREQRPRTIVALRNDLQRQAAQHQELENKWLLEELRAEERLQLEQEFLRLKPLPAINETPVPVEVVEEPPKRLSTAERIAAEKLAAAEANGETSKQYGVFEMMVVRNRNGYGSEANPTVTTTAAEADTDAVEVARVDGTTDIEDGTSSTGGNIEYDDHLLKVAKNDRLETLSNPEARLGRIPEEDSRRGAESAYAMMMPSSSVDNTVFVTGMLRPNIPEAFPSPRDSMGDLSMGTSIDNQQVPQLKFVSPLVRSKLNLSYENPEYRDWETSEKTLGHLEERIRNFALSPIGVQSPKAIIQPPKLARFEKGDEIPSQPRPGGRVVIRRRVCPVAGREYNMPNHRHTKYRILPSIPNFDQMQKAKMLAYMTIDEERRARLTQSEPSLNRLC